MTYEWQRPSKSQHDYKKPTATTVLAHCVKITQNVAFEFFSILAFSTNICPIKTNLPCNTI